MWRRRRKRGGRERDTREGALQRLAAYSLKKGKKLRTK